MSKYPHWVRRFIGISAAILGLFLATAWTAAEPTPGKEDPLVAEMVCAFLQRGHLSGRGRRGPPAARHRQGIDAAAQVQQRPPGIQPEAGVQRQRMPMQAAEGHPAPAARPLEFC